MITLLFSLLSAVESRFFDTLEGQQHGVDSNRGELFLNRSNQLSSRLQAQRGFNGFDHCQDQRNFESSNSVRALLEYFLKKDIGRQNFENLNLVPEKNPEKEIKILIDRFSDLNVVDISGWGLLHWNVFGGHAETMKLLIEKGANLNVKSRIKATPLHLAIILDQEECIRLLIKSGADVNAEDEEGLTPIHWAIKDCKFGSIAVFWELTPQIFSKPYKACLFRSMYESASSRGETNEKKQSRWELLSAMALMVVTFDDRKMLEQFFDKSVIL